MQKSIFYSHDCGIYPGEFVPCDDEKNNPLMSYRAANRPLVNLSELDDSFIIEVAIPGFSRDRLMVESFNNILSLNVLQKEKNKTSVEKKKIHEFDKEIFQRQIALPENADTEFISSEYRDGILKIHLPKTNNPSRNIHRRIMVY